MKKYNAQRIGVFIESGFRRQMFTNVLNALGYTFIDFSLQKGLKVKNLLETRILIIDEQNTGQSLKRIMYLKNKIFLHCCH
jgi:hypothetical protein